MKKLNFNDNNNLDLNKVIKEIENSPYLTKIKVDMNNLNECLILIEEKNNCLNCKGLKECKNHQKGYCYDYNEGFYLKRCKYKALYDEKNKNNSLIKTLYMPQMIREANLAGYQVINAERIKILKAVNDFILNFNEDNFQKGLYIHGTYQSGKTYILGALTGELAKRNIKTLIIYFPDLIRELKNALLTPRFEEIINMLKEIPVLMIDDIGSETMTTWVRDEILGPILNYRYSDKKPVFFSSNLSIEQLRDHLILSGDAVENTKALRIITRIMGLATPITSGEKYRS